MLVGHSRARRPADAPVRWIPVSREVLTSGSVRLCSGECDSERSAANGPPLPLLLSRVFLGGFSSAWHQILNESSKRIFLGSGGSPKPPLPFLHHDVPPSLMQGARDRGGGRRHPSSLPRPNEDVSLIRRMEGGGTGRLGSREGRPTLREHHLDPSQDLRPPA